MVKSYNGAKDTLNPSQLENYAKGVQPQWCPPPSQPREGTLKPPKKVPGVLMRVPLLGSFSGLLWLPRFQCSSSSQELIFTSSPNPGLEELGVEGRQRSTRRPSQTSPPVGE